MTSNVTRTAGKAVSVDAKQAYREDIWTKCNRLTQQFIAISTTIDTWAICFDSIESSSGPQRLQIQFLQKKNWICSL